MEHQHVFTLAQTGIAPVIAIENNLLETDQVIKLVCIRCLEVCSGLPRFKAEIRKQLFY